MSANSLSILLGNSVLLASLFPISITKIFRRPMDAKTIRRCPQCRRETSWKDNPWKPFCSERCRMIDLGRWASEEYRVPMTETPDDVATDFEPEVNSDERS